MAGLVCGADGGSPVWDKYQPPFKFTGTLYSATVDVSGEQIKGPRGRDARAHGASVAIRTGSPKTGLPVVCTGAVLCIQWSAYALSAAKKSLHCAYGGDSAVHVFVAPSISSPTIFTSNTNPSSPRLARYHSTLGSMRLRNLQRPRKTKHESASLHTSQARYAS